MTTPRKIDFTKMSDDEINDYKIMLKEKKLEAIRIYQLARKTLMEVNEFHDFQMEKIKEATTPPPLPRMDSNHRGMD